MYVCTYVRPKASARLPLEGFSSNFVLGLKEKLSRNTRRGYNLASDLGQFVWRHKEDYTVGNSVKYCSMTTMWRKSILAFPLQHSTRFILLTVTGWSKWYKGEAMLLFHSREIWFLRVCHLISNAVYCSITDTAFLWLCMKMRQWYLLILTSKACRPSVPFLQDWKFPNFCSWIPQTLTSILNRPVPRRIIKGSELRACYGDWGRSM